VYEDFGILGMGDEELEEPGALRTSGAELTGILNQIEQVGLQD
jgi:hypothetical protein